MNLTTHSLDHIRCGSYLILIMLNDYDSPDHVHERSLGGIIFVLHFATSIMILLYVSHMDEIVRKYGANILTTREFEKMY